MPKVRRIIILLCCTPLPPLLCYVWLILRLFYDCFGKLSKLYWKLMESHISLEIAVWWIVPELTSGQPWKKGSKASVSDLLFHKKKHLFRQSLRGTDSNLQNKTGEKTLFSQFHLRTTTGKQWYGFMVHFRKRWLPMPVNIVVRFNVEILHVVTSVILEFLKLFLSQSFWNIIAVYKVLRITQSVKP